MAVIAAYITQAFNDNGHTYVNYAYTSDLRLMLTHKHLLPYS